MTIETGKPADLERFFSIFNFTQRAAGRRLGVQLDTERLTLRPLTLDDLDDLARFLSDPETMRYIGGGGTRTRDQARETLERMIESFQARGYGQLGVERKEDGAFLGRCGLLVWDIATVDDRRRGSTGRSRSRSATSSAASTGATATRPRRPSRFGTGRSASSGSSG